MVTTVRSLRKPLPKCAHEKSYNVCGDQTLQHSMYKLRTGTRRRKFKQTKMRMIEPLESFVGPKEEDSEV